MTCSQSRRPKPWRWQPVAASHDADASLKALLGVPSRIPKARPHRHDGDGIGAERSYEGLRGGSGFLRGRLRLAASTPASPPSLLRVVVRGVLPESS